MLLRAPTLLVAALFTASVMAKACQPGKHRDNQGNCVDCADGYISSDLSPDGQPPYSCQPCPAGQSSNPAHTQCQKCSPGTYNDVDGGLCRDCATGYFNNVSGAKACCQCCAGFYSNNPRTHCNSCPNDKPFSYPGSNSHDDCTKDKQQPGEPDPVSKCDMVADNVCPNTTGPGPVGSAITRKKRAIHCTKGFESCPHYSGQGGTECVDTHNDPESCGGCVTLDGTGTGTDCTAIDNVSVSRCVKGSCVVDSCTNGYAPSSDGSSCAPRAGSGPQAFGQSLGATAKRVMWAQVF